MEAMHHGSDRLASGQGHGQGEGGPEEAHGVTMAMPHHKVPYFLIFFLLVGLTGITVLVAGYRFNREIVNVLLALLIASVKATAVAFYFMHLKFEGKLIYLILIIPLLLCILLVVALIPDIIHGQAFTRMASYPGER